MAGINLLKENRRERIFRYAPLVLWIGVIFFASTMLGSMSNTSRFIRPLLIFLFPNAPEETLVIYHVYIRKFAHFAEYAILAFFAARAVSGSSVKILQKFWFVFAFVLVVLVASIDETNQSFNSTRTGSMTDVLLDCSGGLTMIIFFYIYRLRKNI
ncbi:MAG: VanZ family protein [Pyrinomonadaceae bacterium]